MPSDIVYGPNSIHTKVSWGSNEEGVVQITTMAVKNGEPGSEPTDRLLKIVNDWLETAGMPLIDVDDLRARLPFEPYFDGWVAVLDEWGQCNRLIKILKRARDRQFGIPE